MSAAAQLRAGGYDAFSLAGGMRAWSLAWNAVEVPVALPATVLQVQRIGKGCLSYIAGSEGEAVVIDAALDPQVYIDLAKQRNWAITHVVDTHIHADHLSRSRALAERTGANLHLPAQDRASFPFTPIEDGDEFVIGNARLTALATPGHTMESMTYRLDDAALLTGDTLFLASVGRPDLEASPEQARTRARLLYQSLQRLVLLPGDLPVLPGHTSETIGFGDKPIAQRLEAVIDAISVLRLSEDRFVNHITAHLPPAPANHSAIVSLNEVGEMPPGDPADLEAGANRCAIH
jgi:glyoxylase-like metal-dependent hydrolase (beta-lactamase superfamily II)